MTTRVVRAFFHDGSLNAGTPLEMASTPVTAAPPEAKACSTTNSVGAVEQHAVDALPARHGALDRARDLRLRQRRRSTYLTRPTPSRMRHVDDEEVGRDGEGLARLLHAPEVAAGDDAATKKTAMGSDPRLRARGNAEASAAAPAAVDTATVRT